MRLVTKATTIKAAARSFHAPILGIVFSTKCAANGMFTNVEVLYSVLLRIGIP